MLGFAATLPFKLNIKGHGDKVVKNLELSDIGEGKTKINFDLKSVKLPSNR